jgi:hypothetical protein
MVERDSFAACAYLRLFSGSIAMRANSRLHRSLRLFLDTLLLCTASAVIAPTSSQAPDGAQPRRKGFWLNTGVGTGVELSGVAYCLRIGGAPNDDILLAGELIHFWQRREDGLEDFRENTTASVLYQPGRWPLGIYLKAGVGLAIVSKQAVPGGFVVTQTSEGVGITVGAGLDIPVAHGLSITPSVDILHSIGVRDAPGPLVAMSVGLTVL